jgi:hypothetical protein
MTERRGLYDVNARATVEGLRDDTPVNDTVEGAAIAFALGLAFARVGGGLVEVLFPKLFLRIVGRKGSATDGAALGFRMKGGRDVAIGLATLAAATNRDRIAVANLTATGIVVDAIDGLAVHRDGGQSLRSPVFPHGAWLGYLVAIVAGLAAAILRRPVRR